MRKAKEKATEAYQKSKKISAANRKARKSMYQVDNMQPFSNKANFRLLRFFQ